MLLSVLLTLPALAAAHSSWYQPRDSPVHDLFKRQNNGTKPDWKTNADGKSRREIRTVGAWF